MLMAHLLSARSRVCHHPARIARNVPATRGRPTRDQELVRPASPRRPSRRRGEAGGRPIESRGRGQMPRPWRPSPLLRPKAQQISNARGVWRVDPPHALLMPVLRVAPSGRVRTMSRWIAASVCLLMALSTVAAAADPAPATVAVTTSRGVRQLLLYGPVDPSGQEDP